MLDPHIDLPQPSEAARAKACSLLLKALGQSKVLTAGESCEKYALDKSDVSGRVPDAVVLAETADDVVAALTAAQQAEVPMISMASSTKIAEPVEERKWVFKVTWNDSLTMESTAKYLGEHGLKKVGWLSISTAFGEDGREAFVAVAPNYGVTLVAQEKMNPGDTDMTAQLAKIKGLNPDALIIYSIVPELSIATKNARDLGFDIPVIAEGGATHPKFIELAGGAEVVEGVLSFGGKYSYVDQLADSDPQKAEINRYNEAFRQEIGEEPDHFGAHAWDAWHAALQAIEKAGPDRAAIRDALEETDFVGCSGIFKMSPTDHAGMAVESIASGYIHDGNFVLHK